MSTRSLLTNARLDMAGNSHDCQFNSRHRIVKGDTRLKVRNKRSWDHYCLQCAQSIVSNSQNSLTHLAAQVSEALASKPRRA